MKVHEEIIEVVTINDIVQEYADSTFPDLLCVDIEYLDTAVLESADFSTSKPKVICCEVLDEIPGQETKIYSVLEKKGFSRYARMGHNVIFVESALLPKIW